MKEITYTGIAIMELLRFTEIASRLQTDENTGLRLIEEGTIPVPTLIGDLVRWSVADLESWWQAGCPSSKPPTRRRMVDIRSALFQEQLVRCDELIDKIGEQRASEIYDKLFAELEG